MSQQQKIRRVIMTGVVAAITATGAWYGAGLKTQREFKQEQRTRLEATPQEKIAQLEIARGRLVAKRIELERKIAQLHARRTSSSSADDA